MREDRLSWGVADRRPSDRGRGASTHTLFKALLAALVLTPSWAAAQGAPAAQPPTAPAAAAAPVADPTRKLDSAMKVQIGNDEAAS